MSLLLFGSFHELRNEFGSAQITKMSKREMQHVVIVAWLLSWAPYCVLVWYCTNHKNVKERKATCRRCCLAPSMSSVLCRSLISHKSQRCQRETCNMSSLLFGPFHELRNVTEFGIKLITKMSKKEMQYVVVVVWLLSWAPYCVGVWYCTNHKNV